MDFSSSVYRRGHLIKFKMVTEDKVYVCIIYYFCRYLLQDDKVNRTVILSQLYFDSFLKFLLDWIYNDVIYLNI